MKFLIVLSMLPLILAGDPPACEELHTCVLQRWTPTLCKGVVVDALSHLQTLLQSDRLPQVWPQAKVCPGLTSAAVVRCFTGDDNIVVWTYGPELQGLAGQEGCGLSVLSRHAAAFTGTPQKGAVTKSRVLASSGL